MVCYLHILNYDGELLVGAVLCQQILTVTSEGEKFVVKALKVRLSHNQAFTYQEEKK